MPDHIHLILFVTDRISMSLRNHIARFKASCRLPEHSAYIPLFEKGFHDRILSRAGQLQAMRKYVADNPRRFIIKCSNPDLFRRYNRIQIEGRVFDAYGNIFLLRDFDKMAVAVHRADTDEKRAHDRDTWLRCADNGGVLISPFISKAEKDIREAAISLGGRIIHIRNEGFEKRFKPSGRDFDLCASGRLLLIAPWPEKLNRSIVTRKEALEMNALASDLAALGPERLSLRQSGRKRHKCRFTERAAAGAGTAARRVRGGIRPA